MPSIPPGKMFGRRRSDAALAAALRTFTAKAGLDEASLTPKAREAVLDLLSELVRLRGELDKARTRSTTLERLAHEDALMPVANRRAFMRELSRLVALSKRYGSESSIVYIDLDDMKAINDRHGHNAGDAALQHIARILVENVRHADIVARLGGDEFGILLVKTGRFHAEEKAAALADLIRSRPLVWDGHPIWLSASFGAHSFNGQESVEQAIEAADRAMYRSKQAGKAAEAS
ncbi:MAG TPA: GGDEF domain-containing protein [Aliidongia sp.]|nr:GGDEF domain-containing protein [Aliidongia sp.]